MAWYLAPALAVGRSEVNRRWPKRDKDSDGTIGDAAHQASRSDHNPNLRESVDAWDMDKDGVDVWEVIRAFQRHPSAHYWIFQEQIADADDGWRRRSYSGDNPHNQHVHFSIRQSAAAEQDRRPWGLVEEAIMPALSDDDQRALIWRVEAIGAGRLAVAGGPTRGEAVVINQRQVTMEQKLAALADVVAGVDEQTAARLRTEFAAIEAAAADRAAAQLAAMDVLRGELADDLATNAVPAIVAAVRAQLAGIDEAELTASITAALRGLAAQLAVAPALPASG
ncbi:hypothetical protein [Phytohabitans aurantiacus]|uniref:MobA/MobL protein domain-containing protein n=1 Tax=Phytohabitans aurantiacus TaxID=3016789 RepID=A0ABQ5QMB8_9ACTN|nr:hypothetical protein [Phytohabitans aurantiacus]GLH94889.1 hypothetical protein Pa4123_01610 [Phytohabitans aurantiacus]